MVYFEEETLEECLIFMDCLGKCITGQNATSGAAKFVLATRLMGGAVKMPFENAVQLCGGTTTNTSFQECLNALTANTPPHDTAESETINVLFLKSWLRTTLHKCAQSTATLRLFQLIQVNNLQSCPPTSF